MFQDPDSVRGKHPFSTIYLKDVTSGLIVFSSFLPMMPNLIPLNNRSIRILILSTSLLISDFVHHIAGGIILHGFKFMAVRADADEVVGRKGEKGVFIIPTQQAILVAEVSPRSPRTNLNQ